MSDPGAGRWTLGGAALATGCSCCMFTGAASGSIGTARQPAVEPEPALGTAG